MQEDLCLVQSPLLHTCPPSHPFQPCHPPHRAAPQAIDKLRLEGGNRARARPRAVGMESCVGTEYVPFKTPLALEGKVRLQLWRAGVPALEEGKACCTRGGHNCGKHCRSTIVERAAGLCLSRALRGCASEEGCGAVAAAPWALRG